MAKATAARNTLIDEIDRHSRRLGNFATEFVVNREDPPIGRSPRTTVWRRGKFQLHRFHSQSDARVEQPYLIIPWLGISHWHILDMLPGNSMIEFLLTQGHDVFLLDWGRIGPEDSDISLERIVQNIIPRVVDQVLSVTGAETLNLNGLCLGGVISSCYLALDHSAPVKNFVSIVTPVDFNEGGLFKAWIGNDEFPAEAMLERFGGVPTSLMGVGFKMLRPLSDVTSLSSLWFKLEGTKHVAGFKAMNQWANDYVAMPGRFFLTLARDLYRDNKLYRNELQLGGRPVDMSSINMPVLVVSASQDHIVPPSAARAMIDVIGSDDKEYLELPGGHISVFSGRSASTVLWPKIHEWLMERN